MDWLRRNIHQRHSVVGMATRIHVSRRTLARRFHEQAGTTPMRWLTRERVRRAQELLEATSRSIEEIAADCGFGSAQLLRFHFHRIAGTSPTAYRASFRGRQNGVATR
jgi:transcriptional regulator GlxA family with amidase domain